MKMFLIKNFMFRTGNERSAFVIKDLLVMKTTFYFLTFHFQKKSLIVFSFLILLIAGT